MSQVGKIRNQPLLNSGDALCSDYTFVSLRIPMSRDENSLKFLQKFILNVGEWSENE